MDINRCAEEILAQNLQTYKEVCFVSKSLLKSIVKRHIWQKKSQIVVLGYQRDVDRFLKCFPKKYDNVVCEYVEPQDWMNMPGKEFHNEEAVHRIAKFTIDKLVIVSEDLRYLLQMCLIAEGVTYEIVDIYELIKREYSKVLVTGINSTLWKRMKEYIKRQNYDWLEKITVLKKMKYVRLLIEASVKKCDNYDGILVKKYYYKKSSKDKEKRYYLAELIVNYLMIKDFQNAFKYIDEFISLFGREGTGNAFLNIKNQFIELFSQMKEQLSRRDEKDIIIFWCDALSYSDFKKWNFLEELEKDSLVFENAYTHIPYTHTTIQAMFTGEPFFEGKLYHTVESGVMIQHGKTIDLLEEKHYKIYEPGHTYINKKYTNKLNYTLKSSYPPATMNLWETLAQLLNGDDNKKFIICHMDCELHNPYWNGTSEKLRVDPGNFLTDITDFLAQRKESADYLQNQILYYLSFISDKTCKIFMSDHGIEGAAYAESRLHAFCFVKDLNIVKGNYKEYFSYLNFYDLIDYILDPSENNLDKIFSDYVLIQNDHPYSEKYCNMILNRIENGEILQWKEWMGFRGIIKDGYKLILFPGCHEIWFDSEDREIEPENISDLNLVQFMREKVGNVFPDISSDQHYVNTKKLYEKLHYMMQENIEGMKEGFEAEELSIDPFE